MIRLFTASLFVAGLVVARHGHGDPQPKQRKSLGFGPVLPHTTFQTIPYQSPSFVPPNPSACPFATTQRFVDELLGGKSQYTIRKDSYTDKNTGVTHVYVRQLVNGLEVADGDINVNVKDGVILSWGNSFYDGPKPLPFTSPADDLPHTHAQYCVQLADELHIRSEELAALTLQSDQIRMPSSFSPEHILLRPLQHIHESNCEHVHLPYIMHQNSVAMTEHNVHNALLQFMIAATPKPSIVQDILAKYDEYLANMRSEFTAHLVGSHETVSEVIHNVPDTVSPVKARLVYVQVPHGSETALSLVWKFEVEMEDNWYEASVSAVAPHRIVSVVDWASDSPLPFNTAPIPPPTHESATYNVFKWGVNDPSVGNRSIEKEYIDSLASPRGWHSYPLANDPQPRMRGKDGEVWKNTTDTSGNNVFAHSNWEGSDDGWYNNYRPDGGKDMVFDFPYKPKVTTRDDALDEAKKYVNATVTQLFYTTNMVHDLYYRYGFDEESGNFQQHNFGRGGEENDAVIANAQDGSGYNNANFMTPPDGQNGRCRMYLWSTAIPFRDGDLEAGIVIHELSHGLSTRLTGGPANSGCLGWGESGGMGEGWGDFLATTIRSNRNYSDYPMGAWAANVSDGIRHFVYSVNDTINPSTYKTLDKPGYWGVHAIGEVWAEILWVVSQKLIKKHGYVDTLFPPQPLEDGTIPEGDFYRPREIDCMTGKEKPLVPKHGNSLIVQLVINGMKLQICRPSFFDARDAIIQADQVLTGGENYCELWEGFSERGLGPDARVEGRTPWGGGIRTNDFSLPLACQHAPRQPEPEVPEPEEPEDLLYWITI